MRPQHFYLFLLFSCFYLITTPGHLYTHDSRVSYETTKSLVTKGSLEISWSSIAVRDVEGRATGRYGLLQMALCIPLYLVGQGLDTVFPDPPFLYENWRITWVATFNQWIAALSLVFFFRILTGLGLKVFPAFVATCVLGFASPWWTYSRDLFRQPIAGLLFLIAIDQSLKFGRSRHWGHLFGVGVSLGLSFTNRITAAVTWPGYGLLILSRLKGMNLKRILTISSIIIALILIGVGVQIATNYWRFGHWWGWAYENRIFKLGFLKRNVPDLLLSPARGLLLFSPPLILSVHGFFATWRTDRWLAVSVAAMFGAKMLLFGTYYDYTGGMNPGPRYLIPILPVLYLLVGVLVGKEWDCRNFRWSFLGLAGLGFIVNGFNSLVPYHLTLTFWDWVWRYVGSLYAGYDTYPGRDPWNATEVFYDVLIGRWLIDGHFFILFLYLGCLVGIIALTWRKLIPFLDSDRKESKSYDEENPAVQ